MKMKGFVCALLLMAGLVALSAPGASAEEVKFELKASAAMRDILVDKTGKRVALRLASGDDIEGICRLLSDNSG